MNFFLLKNLEILIIFKEKIFYNHSTLIQTIFISFLLFLFILFLAALDFLCCVHAFSNCSEQGLLPSCGDWALGCQICRCGTRV